MQAFLTDTAEVVRDLIILGGGIALGIVSCVVLFWLLNRVAQKSVSYVGASIIKHIRAPSLWIAPLVAVILVIPLLKLMPSGEESIKHVISIIMIGLLSWLIFRMSNVLEDIIIHRHPRDVADNLRARRVYTQLKIFKRVILVVIGVLAVGSVLMTFDKVRQLGTSILASAGIMGVVIGFAAQRILANFLASIQVAITEPIRIDDVVIVEGEWGWIEEINITYVVVRIWDLRRLIVPISYFTDKPFENWTRATSDLLGSVYLYVDYTVPVDRLREELHRILKSSKKWDGKAWALEVTDATEHVMQVRALMSAKDSSSAWDLRCEVREKLIHFIQENFPHALPRMRAEISQSSAAGGPAAPPKPEPKSRPTGAEKLI
jgi:small-conductance mechanosensitive channel